MTTPDPTASVYFEAAVPKLAPESLRKSLMHDMVPRIEALAPRATRDGWADRPIKTAPTPAAILDHVNDCFQEADPGLLAKPTAASDFYCLSTGGLVCYFLFNVELNGSPYSFQVHADGLQMTCPLMAVVRYDPTGTAAAYVELTGQATSGEASATT